MDSMLCDLSGKQLIEGEDPRWINFFDCREILQLNGKEDLFRGSNFLEMLVQNNPLTGNLLELMDQTVSRMRFVAESRDRKQEPTRAKIIQCCSAMHLTSLILNAFFAHLSSSEIRAQLRLHADWPSNISSQHISPTKLSESGRGGRTIGALIDEAVDILSSNPVPSYMYEVAYCSANLLLCAFSAELYNMGGECLFMDYLHISSKAQVKSAQAEKSKDTTFTMPAYFLRGLLAHGLSPSSDTQASKSALLTLSKFREGAEGMSHGEGVNTNFIFLLVQRLLRMGSDSHPAGKDRNRGAATLIRAPRNPLQERCKNLLGVLLYAKPAHADVQNYVLDMFLSLVDQKHETVDSSSENGRPEAKKGLKSRPFEAIHSDFDSVVSNIAETLPSEGSLLLLYAFLHKHPTFLAFVTSSKERTRTLLLAVLRGLYLCGENFPTDSLYVLVICLLLLVQNPKVQGHMTSLTCTVPWYKEHFLRDVCAADLVLLVTLRVTMFALFRLHDQYLISNCFAIILDLAHNLTGIGSYVSERLSNLIILLARRLQRDNENVEKAALNETTFDTLAIILKLCGIALRPAKRESNAHLLYALVHECERIAVVLPHANAETPNEGEGPGHGSGEILAALQLGAERALKKEPSSLLLPRQLIVLTHTYFHKLQAGVEEGQGHYGSADKAVAALAALIREETAASTLGPDDPGLLRYSYSEGAESSAFFTPLAWAATIRCSPDLHWYPGQIQLFDPVASGILPSEVSSDRN